MEDDPRENQEIGWWLEMATVRERPFSSSLPLFGPLIAWFREIWNSVSTKWYVRHLLQQQNEVNKLFVERFLEHDAWLMECDRDNVHLTKESAEMATRLIQMNRLLTSIDGRLSRLELLAQEGRLG